MGGAANDCSMSEGCDSNETSSIFDSMLDNCEKRRPVLTAATGDIGQGCGDSFLRGGRTYCEFVVALALEAAVLAAKNSETAASGELWFMLRCELPADNDLVGVTKYTVDLECSDAESLSSANGSPGT